ncbi:MULTISPECIES: 1-aminocyclopropane-1-carboxylate deaminase/D-cysteine desulfhydrase [Nostocales]|uniref:1-aminocyclopropane-1-carboxylate deaminase/D-cysteine desulfhydrase n=3 Tax=Nostocales TaxID=1161 RepID=A0A8S9TFK2_9CYAN|nr:pyridoxal-phosphate dependent enzyme [Tolypothrix bouteillei]KAF3890279.1 1-aminocyclopropane-1-carboxylate deaminase/D-cysteine desulfhydrase [Tolypothrix bouteillei VB521301]
MLCSQTVTNFFNVPVSPIQEIFDETLTEAKIRLFIKRDDLLNSSVSGNKFRKLKYNCLKIKELGFPRLVTFGGAFSNHIYATAAVGKIVGIETIGIIRGERTQPLNTTLDFAEKCGMKLLFVSRSDFREENLIFEQIEKEYGNVYFLPSGGSNTLALQGCREIVEEIHSQMQFQPDYFCTACGTGCTLAGVIAAVDSAQHIIGFSALKGDFLKNDVQRLLDTQDNLGCQNWQITDNYCFGGYAKWKPELILFINDFKRKHSIALDPIYTGKMFFGIFDLAKKELFRPHTTVVAIHTGGLQGIEGFNQVKLKNYSFKLE